MARSYHLTVFYVFVSLSVVSRGPSEILVLLVNLFFNFSVFFSAIVQILRAKQNGNYCKQNGNKLETSVSETPHFV